MPFVLDQDCFIPSFGRLIWPKRRAETDFCTTELKLTASLALSKGFHHHQARLPLAGRSGLAMLRVPVTESVEGTTKTKD